MGEETLTFREAVESFVNKYGQELEQVGFFESFFDDKKDRIKDGLFVDVANLLSEQGYDARKELESFFSTQSLTEIVTDVVWDCATGDNGDLDEMFVKVDEILYRVKEEKSEESSE